MNKINSILVLILTISTLLISVQCVNPFCFNPYLCQKLFCKPVPATGCPEGYAFSFFYGPCNCCAGGGCLKLLNEGEFCTMPYGDPPTAICKSPLSCRYTFGFVSTCVKDPPSTEEKPKPPSNPPSNPPPKPPPKPNQG